MERQLQRHRQKDTTYYRCDTCGYKNSSRITVLAHQRKKHHAGIYQGGHAGNDEGIL